MNVAKIVSVLGILVMAGVIGYAFLVGDFAAEGAQLMSMPWGIVSLVDLYTGFTLFSGWVIFREKSLVAKIGWIVAIMTLGAFAMSLYALLALQASRGDWKKFWMGSQA